MDLAVFLISAFVLYFASSGAAFVIMYRWPHRFSAELATRLYAPLEWMARHFRPFGRIYTGFHFWCYRHFVQTGKT
jgi:hypothetical protein